MAEEMSISSAKHTSEPETTTPQPEKIPQAHGGALTPFQPGQSGNPAGKPKGARHLSTVIQEFMDDDTFELKLKDGKTLRGRPSKHLVQVMYSLAISGNVKAAEWMAKHGYGTKQVHEFMNNPIRDILGQYGLNEEPKAEEPKPEEPNARQTEEVKG